jgi:hypothetical protein
MVPNFRPASLPGDVIRWTRWKTSIMKFLRIALLLLTLQAASATLAHSKTAFETFRNLQGRWAIQTDKGKPPAIEMTYANGSKGSIVTEQFGQELSVIYRDGGRLLMTHFCNAGVQPRLRLKEGSRPGLYEFEMFDITNLKSAAAAHVQRIIYRIVDGKTIDLEIVWQKGQKQESEKYVLSKL